MKKTTRKILFFIFVLAFVLITPLLSLYATGYKFSLSGNFLQKTGMLVIDSTPSGANIIINGEAQQNFFNELNSKITKKTEQQNILKTPAKIKGLLPGEYDIRLEKDGYWPWEKKLEISPGNSTFAEDVFLFKNNLPQPLFSSNILKAVQSQNKKNIVFISDKQYILLNLDNEKTSFYDKSETDTDILNSILWIDNNNVLINSKLFSINKWESPEDFSTSLLNISPNSIKLNNSNSIFFKKNNDVIKFDFKTQGIETVINTEKLFDFSFKNNLFYTIEEKDEKIYLVVYENKKNIRQINLSYDEDYAFIETDQNLINIYNKKFKTLYLVDPFDYFSPLKDTINNVENIFWVDSDRLVFYNDFEIWMYDKRINKKTILTRISSDINNVLWHPSNNYLIYSTDTSLFTIELDDRDKYNTNQLLNLNNINFLNINTKGDVLYFFAKLGNQNSFLKLSI